MAVVAKLDRDRALYPVMLIVIGSYYVLFAVMGGPETLLPEILVSILFTVLALAAFRWSLWLAVAGMAAHGLFDFTHSFFIRNPGVPTWWPGFCGAIDLTAAAFLGIILVLRTQPSGK
jgi:hypothetical protein